jgi:hypothetical protein
VAEENAVLGENATGDEELTESFDLNELEEKLQTELGKELADLEFLKEEKEKIGNPDALGKVVMDEVWKQFTNQIGLEVTNETLIQKYDREHPETYKEVGKTVMQDQKYKDANKAMKEKQQAGNLKDEYTGKDLSQNDSANLDHVVARKELYENKRRRQANIQTEDLANKDENLKPTNESLNKSKNAKSMDDYLSTQEERQKSLQEQNEKANKKIDESNMSDLEKQKAKEKNDKRLQDKLDADAELTKKADKEARKAINKDIYKGVAKETAKKAGKDALKIIAIQALSSMLKEIINALVRFFKSATKSFKTFLDEMKKAVQSFFSKISNFLQAGANSVVGTIVTEIFGPVVSMFKKLASFIKQGVSSLIESIRYLTNKENAKKPFSIKVLEVGKIISAGIMAGGALVLGEVFEKLLLTVPFMAIEIPLFGTLANIFGLFFAALLCGVIGAIIMNLLDKAIANKSRKLATDNQVLKGNEVLSTQHKIKIVSEVQLENDKENARANIYGRHQEAGEIMRDSFENIMDDFVSDFSDSDKSIVIDEEDVKTVSQIDSVSDDLDTLLKSLD